MNFAQALEAILPPHRVAKFREYLAKSGRDLPETPESQELREQDRRDRIWRGQIESALQNTGIPFDYLKANLDMDEMGNPLDIHPLAGQAHGLCLRLLSEWVPGHKGLVLASPATGCGKTYRLMAVLLGVIRRRGSEGHLTHGAFITASDLLSAYRESFRVSDDGTITSSLQIFEHYAKQPDILMIDDLGSDPIKDDERGKWARDKFEQIISYRYQQNRTTLATTNLSLEELKRHYGPRMVSRLIGRSAFIVMDGDDYRQRGFAPGMVNNDPFSEA